MTTCTPSRAVPLVSLVAAVVLASCTKSQPANEDLTKLTSRVEELETEDRVRKLLADLDSIAFLKPTSTEYSQVKIDLGYVTVSIDNVSDYANGSKVVLTFGNPTTAALVNLSADLEWGRVDEKGNPTGEVYSKSQEFTDPLPAGSWHKFEVNLADLPPKDLGYLRVKNVVHKSISLRPTD